MANSDESLARVALAISAYRSDDSVIRLLESAFTPGQPRFGVVLVVDSLGSGQITRVALGRGWKVDYVNADRNLGSAGNLDLRLQTTAELGMDWCFAVNHDGVVEPTKVLALLRHGSQRERVGAVYPQLIFSSADHRPDSIRRGFGTLGLLGRGQPTNDNCAAIEVAWSSSNGALYNLQPIRDGITAWPDLWMGYEDLALGWELQSRGWVQLVCTDVFVTDNYEFRPVRLFGRTVHLASKPSWYAYYQIRNLLLIARRARGTAVGWGGILLRFLADVALTLFYRSQKRERLHLLFKGALDGLRGISGKGPVP